MSAEHTFRQDSATSGISAYFVVAAVVALAVLTAAGLYAHRAALRDAYLWSDFRSSSSSTVSVMIPRSSSERLSFMTSAELVEVDLEADAPAEITVPIGVPIDVRVTGGGRGEVVSFRYPQAQAAVRGGEALIRLPALSPGVYPFGSESGGCSGILIAR